MKLMMRCAVGVLVAGGATVSAQSVAWNETSSGDLSNDPNAPTPVTMNVGDNFLIGGVTSSSGDTRDYITFTIAPGQALVGLDQVIYVDPLTNQPANRGFHAINDGATSFIPDPMTAGLFLGGAHLDPLPTGTDMLPILASAPQAGTGFTVPLGPGTYSYLIQQTGPDISVYSFNFRVVPAPGAVVLLGGAGLLAVRRRRG